MDDMRYLQATLQGFKEELHASSARQANRVAELLADSFVEFGSSGVTYSKAQIISALAAEPGAQISATDFSAHFVAHDVALLTYRGCRHSIQHVFSLRSSIWQLQAGRWRILFHQGTPYAAPEEG